MRQLKNQRKETCTMSTSRILLVAASVLFALAPGFVSANRALLSKRELRETYQRLEAYANR
jgi:hypothetical protein